METNIDLKRQRVEGSVRVTSAGVIGEPWRKQRRLSATMERYLQDRNKKAWWKQRRLLATTGTPLLVLAITAVVGLALGVTQAILLSD
jgi:hypothetical protein